MNANSQIEAEPRAETDERESPFAHQRLEHVRHVLDERSTHLAPKSRYAEIFAYDDQRQLFSLENPA
jgi:hypothetical protein